MSVKIMSFNIMNFGKSRLDSFGSNKFNSFCNLMAYIIKVYNVDLLGMMEIQSQLGYDLGKGLVQTLNNPPYNLNYHWQASPVLGSSNNKRSNRKEQYVYVWNQNNFTPKSFDTNFLNAANLQVVFHLKGERPPYLGMFDVNGIEVPIILYHSRGPGSHPEWCNKELATIAYLASTSHPNGAIVMGDFNITPSAIDKSRPRSSAYRSFYPLYTIGMPWQLYTAPNTGILTSLRSKKYDPTDVNGIFKSDYDNFYVRTGGVAASAKRINLLEFVSPSTTDPIFDSLFRTYLYQQTCKKTDPKIGQVSAYTDVKNSFKHFRYFFSDHMPILLEIAW